MEEIIRKDRTYLEFEPGWDFKKLDALPIYKKARDSLPGFKSVDYISISPGNDLYFFELKDFRSPSTTKEETKNLPLIVASKFKDSIATLIAGSRDPESKASLEPYIHKLIVDHCRVKLYFIIESDRAYRNPAQWKSRLSVYTKQLKKYLRWMPIKPFVISEVFGNLPAGVSQKTSLANQNRAS